MYKYRAEITKGEEVRYISHLDYAGVIQRAICRAHLPAAYSEGFNPHMKMAFASASNCALAFSNLLAVRLYCNVISTQRPPFTYWQE